MTMPFRWSAYLGRGGVTASGDAVRYVSICSKRMLVWTVVEVGRYCGAGRAGGMEVENEGGGVAG